MASEADALDAMLRTAQERLFAAPEQWHHRLLLVAGSPRNWIASRPDLEVRLLDMCNCGTGNVALRRQGSFLDAEAHALCQGDPVLTALIADLTQQGAVFATFMRHAALSGLPLAECWEAAAAAWYSQEGSSVSETGERRFVSATGNGFVMFIGSFLLAGRVAGSDFDGWFPARCSLTEVERDAARAWR